MQTIQVKGIEFPLPVEALQHAKEEGGKAIAIGGRYIVTTQAEITRLAREGISFASLHIREMPSGEPRIVTVPIN